MTDMNISDELESLARQIQRQAQAARENEEQLNKLTNEDHVEARLAAEERVAKLEEENALAEKRVESLLGQIRGQRQQLRDIRAALNAKGRNPLTDHAHAIFQALAEANPEHPLVVREPGMEPERASLSKMEMRFIYACLQFTREQVKDLYAGHDDWVVKNPNEATLRFMNQVEKFVKQVNPSYQEHEIKVDNHGYAWGHSLTAMVMHLQKLLKDVYGEGTFEGTEELGLRWDNS